MAGWLVGSLVGLFFYWLVGLFSFGCLLGCLVGRMFGWLEFLFVESLVGLWVAWLFVFSVGSLVY